MPFRLHQAPADGIELHCQPHRRARRCADHLQLAVQQQMARPHPEQRLRLHIRRRRRGLVLPRDRRRNLRRGLHVQDAVGSEDQGLRRHHARRRKTIRRTVVGGHDKAAPHLLSRWQRSSGCIAQAGGQRSDLIDHIRVKI